MLIDRIQTIQGVTDKAAIEHHGVSNDRERVAKMVAGYGTNARIFRQERTKHLGV
jgi:hypothetical protein